MSSLCIALASRVCNQFSSLTNITKTSNSTVLLCLLSLFLPITAPLFKNSSSFEAENVFICRPLGALI